MKITERGWAGHFIDAENCRFKRNTLIGNEKDLPIIVSTVGIYVKDNDIRTLSNESYYETKVFVSKIADGVYFDIDVTREIPYDNTYKILKINKDSDFEVDLFHNKIVEEIKEKMEKEENFFLQSY